MKSSSLETTESLAADFVRSLPQGHTQDQKNLSSHSSFAHAIVVGLYGDLGSGKTTFMKGIAKALGIKEIITSPTYVIEKVYFITHRTYSRLIHIDAYRLESADELEKLDWEDIINDPLALVFIEWPERVHELLPKDMLKIHFVFMDEETREITVEGVDISKE